MYVSISINFQPLDFSLQENFSQATYQLVHRCAFHFELSINLSALHVFYVRPIFFFFTFYRQIENLSCNFPAHRIRIMRHAWDFNQDFSLPRVTAIVRLYFKAKHMGVRLGITWNDTCVLDTSLFHIPC